MKAQLSCLIAVIRDLDFQKKTLKSIFKICLSRLYLATQNSGSLILEGNSCCSTWS